MNSDSKTSRRVSLDVPLQAEFELQKIAKELRPTWRVPITIVVIAFVAFPIFLAWKANNPWIVLGLAFPIMLANTVRLVDLRRQNKILRRAFIWRLSPTDRKRFLEMISSKA